MIGDKKLEMPFTVKEAREIYKYFRIEYHMVGPAADNFFPNANRLVELNNEVYDKLQMCVMHYKVTRDIPKDGVRDEGAKIGEILTAAWHDSWALYNTDNQYVCDMTSMYGTRYCEEMKPTGLVERK